MIIVYKSEIEAGIADAVSGNSSVAFVSVVKPAIADSDSEAFSKLLNTSGQANPNQFDLFYLESVLASVGWNKNDDVFDKNEMWTARSTPVDKQFNFMHNEKDIIGHLTSSKIVDFNGDVIEENTASESLPSKFDLVVGSVLYRHWATPELQERMEKIIKEIGENKWFVSMECLFRNFDYAIVSPSDEQMVLPRTEATAFLTKHLRIYGGSGQYQGYKLGRLLRNFTFSGKGLVDHPANPRSDITNFSNSEEVSLFNGVAVSLANINFKNSEEEKMSEVTQAQYDALKAELNDVKAELTAKNEKAMSELNVKIDELTKANSALQNELEASKEVAKAKDESITAVNKELEDSKQKLTEANDKINKIELEALNASRKSQLLEKVDEEKANMLVEKFANASEEMFKALVESLPAKAKVEDKEDKEDEEKEEECKSEEVDDATDIADAKVEDDVDVSKASEEEETLCAKAAAWLASSVLRSTQKKNEE